MNQKEWFDLLRCPSCEAACLEPTGDGGMRCRHCSLIVQQEDGVYDFLRDAHPVVRRELRAITKTDSTDPDFMATFRRWLATLDNGGDSFTPEDRSSPFLRTALLHRKQIKDLVCRYPLESGGVLIELGADHCWASGTFIDKGVRVVAIDISDHLKMAPRKDSAALLRLKADMNAIPVNDRCVDYVFANACAHHSWDLKRTFSEAHRVLKPGGRLYLCSEPMPGMLRYVLFRIFGSFGKPERESGINETLHRRSQWRRIAERAGFRPLLVFPRFSSAEIKKRLAEKRLPGCAHLAVTPVMKLVQVSMHMIAEKVQVPGEQR